MSADAPAPWIRSAGGVLLVVRLTPKGGRDKIDGVEPLSDGRAVLKARVRAMPTGGQANEALCRLLAKALGVPHSTVTIIAGATARIKRIAIEGDAENIVAALERLVPAR
ncbi:MAG: DUF167 family protein [Xanthobacteraceae bacterium]|uniref:DUF167 family protein n=1 Tax=Pseudolabrys sp. TaxID=1960880 RepID=UPI003D117D8E